MVVNVQRFATTGLITILSGAGQTIGFDKNPLSWLFGRSVKHSIKDHKHEIDRNQILIRELCRLPENQAALRPRLYPSATDFEIVPEGKKYICVAPSSVWFTKTWPAENWQIFISKIPASYVVYIIGGPADVALCEEIKARSNHENIEIRAGKLNFLQSAALISKAVMTYTNDSALCTLPRL